MNWTQGFTLYFLLSIVVSALLCWIISRSKRRADLLPPPRPEASRDAYSPRRYTVGNLRGVE